MTNQTDDFRLRQVKVWDKIHALFAKKNLFSAREARQLLAQWLKEYPNDVYSQEGGNRFP